MKRVVAMLMTSVMILGLAACGSGGGQTTETTEPAATEEAAEETTETTETAETEEDASEAESTGDTYTIGVLFKTLSSPYWQLMQSGLEEQVAQLDNVTIEIFGAESEEDLTGQLNLMENMITSGKYDALCVAPITPTNLISGVVMANEANIPVVNIDEKFDMDALAEAGGYVVGYATSDNVAVGEMAAQEIMNQFPDGAGVCIVEGIAGATSGELRRDGCRDALEAAEGYTVLDVQPGDWDRQTALDVATNMINKYGDELDAIFTANDTMAKGVLQAMINTGREDIFLVSTDADTEVQEAIAAGQLIAVVQDPGGIAFSCVEQAVAALESGNYGSVDEQPEDVLIPATVYTQDNISELMGTE
ncbi:MAG: substrate-binding domain-containing protein [Candidatus Merdisoma sp.]|jgi:D-allose transport system substrate-binding protein